MTTDAAAQAGNRPVGALLRQWREHRRLSQLELASRARVSTRHLSYLENGRSQPTAAMIDRLAESLDVPLRERNGLLLAGGYAPRYRARGLDHADLAPTLAGLRSLLDAHMPNPALLLDDHWNVVDANAAAFLLIGDCEPALLEPPLNVMRIGIHPGGLGRRVRNLDRWAPHLLQQVCARAERTRDPALFELARELESYVGDIRPPEPTSDPVLAFELEMDGQLVRFFGVLAQLETATDVTLAELHLETFLPADAASHEWLRRKVADGLG